MDRLAQIVKCINVIVSTLRIVVDGDGGQGWQVGWGVLCAHAPWTTETLEL